MRDKQAGRVVLIVNLDVLEYSSNLRDSDTNFTNSLESLKRDSSRSDHSSKVSYVLNLHENPRRNSRDSSLFLRLHSPANFILFFIVISSDAY